MCWTWGPYMWGSWWIFPLVGFLFMMLMVFICSGAFRHRGSLCGMGRADNIEELKREIRELKEEIAQINRIGG